MRMESSEARGFDGSPSWSSWTSVGGVGPGSTINPNPMTNNNTSSIAGSTSIKAPSALMRDLVRVALFLKGGEASLEDVRGFIDYRAEKDTLPRGWRTQVRDVLKNDPEIEKADDGVYVLRSAEDASA